jgi:hypothetical protein
VLEPQVLVGRDAGARVVAEQRSRRPGIAGLVEAADPDPGPQGFPAGLVAQLAGTLQQVRYDLVPC